MKSATKSATKTRVADSRRVPLESSVLNPSVDFMATVVGHPDKSAWY